MSSCRFFALRLGKKQTVAVAVSDRNANDIVLLSVRALHQMFQMADFEPRLAAEINSRSNLVEGLAEAG